MTETAVKTKPIAKRLQVSVDKDLNTVTFGDTKIDISAGGKKVTVCAYDGIQMQTAAPAEAVKGTQFSVNEDHSEVILNGITIRKALNGGLIMAVPEDTVVISNIHAAKIAASAPKPIPVSKSSLKVGEKTKDGVYIGRFRNKKDGTESDWFAAGNDATGKSLFKKGRQKLSLTFKEAAAYAKNSKAHGHHDWMLPPGFDNRDGEPNILDAMYRNQQVIGGFKDIGRSPGWYWSSSPCYDFGVSARAQYFGDGFQRPHFKSGGLSVRLVRSVPVV